MTATKYFALLLSSSLIRPDSPIRRIYYGSHKQTLIGLCNCFFRWKPLISRKPALIRRFWFAPLDRIHVTAYHVIGVRRPLVFSANQLSEIEFRESPPWNHFSREFPGIFPSAVIFTFKSVICYFKHTSREHVQHMKILRKRGTCL